MCVLTIPGMTYLPVPSMAASAAGHLPAVLLPILAITPSSTRMSCGPYAGTPVPGMIIALLMSRRRTAAACAGALPPAGVCAAGDAVKTAAAARTRHPTTRRGVCIGGPLPAVCYDGGGRPAEK